MDESLCQDEVKNLIQNLHLEERKTLSQISQEFLRNQLSVIQSRIEAHAENIDRHYPPGTDLPKDQQDLMEVYQIEKALINDLIRESEGELFVKAGSRRLEHIGKRLLQLQGAEKKSDLQQHDFYRAWLEREILLGLVTEWHEAFQEILQ